MKESLYELDFSAVELKIAAQVVAGNVIPYDPLDGLSGTKRKKAKRGQFALRYSVSEPFKVGKV